MTVAGLRRPSGAMSVLRRAGAACALTLALAYPVRSWLEIDGLPVWVRALWPIAVGLAAWRPSASLLAFVAFAQLLPIVPSLHKWPAVSLVAMWLFALLAAAWARLVWRDDTPSLPRSAALFLLLVTSSLVATMAPFSAGAGGASALLQALHAFMRDDFTTLTGQRHVYASMLAWAVVAEGVGLGWLLFRYLRDEGPDAARRLAVAAVTGAGLVAARGLRQWWTREDLLPFWVEFDPFITRINATFTDVNTLGSHMAAMCVLAVALGGASSRRGARVAAWSVAAAMAGACVCTASRSAWLAMLAGLGVYAAAGVRLGLWRVSASRVAMARRGALGLTVLVVAAVLGLSAYATHADVRHINQRSYVDTLLYTLNARIPLDERLKGRVVLWEAAASIVAERPVTGIGIGRFYKDVSLHTSAPDRLPRPQENAHNYFLQLAAETGLPTLVAWLALVGLVLGRGWRSASRLADRATQHVVVGGTGATVALLVTCLTGQPLLLREGQLTFWIALALAGAAGSGPAAGALARRSFVVAAMAVALWTPWRALAELDRVDLARYPAGLYPAELAGDGSSFQWSAAKLVMFVPEGATHVELTLRSVAPMPQSVEIAVNGQSVDRLRLEDHAWRVLRYVLPRHAAGGRFHRIDVLVDPTWKAPGDGRTLGVMIGRYGWTP